MGVPVQGREKLRLLVQLCVTSLVRTVGCSSAHIATTTAMFPLLEQPKEVVRGGSDKKLKAYCRAPWLENCRLGFIAMDVSPERLGEFTETVWSRGRELYRDLPWRNTFDPYAILLSEIMLQQTQVARVLGRWERWLETFPTVADLARAPLPPVLELWQGMAITAAHSISSAVPRKSSPHMAARFRTTRSRCSPCRASTFDICGCAHICISAA